MDYDSIAEWYDSFVHTKKDIPFWVKQAKTARGEVLELASGTGRVSIPLLKAGIHLTCVDGSSRMLWIFRQKLIQKGLFAQTYQMDLADLCLVNRFAMVLFPFDGFAEISGETLQMQLLQRIFEHLKPGGTFICSLQNPIFTREWANGKLKTLGNFPLPDDKSRLRVLIQPQLTPSGNSVLGTQILERFDLRGALVEKKNFPLQYDVIEKSKFESMCSDAGFKKVALFGDYSAVKFNPKTSPSMIWKLRRPR